MAVYKKENKKAGAPRFKLEITDYAEVTKLAGLGMNQSLIADSIGLTERTFARRLAEDRMIFEEAEGKRKQKKITKDNNLYVAWQSGIRKHKVMISKGCWDKARSGDTTMLIFMAKTRLGWREEKEEDRAKDTNIDINVNYVRSKHAD